MHVSDMANDTVFAYVTFPEWSGEKAQETPLTSFRTVKVYHNKLGNWAIMGRFFKFGGIHMKSRYFFFGGFAEKTMGKCFR